MAERQEEISNQIQVLQLNSSCLQPDFNFSFLYSLLQSQISVITTTNSARSYLSLKEFEQIKPLLDKLYKVISEVIIERHSAHLEYAVKKWDEKKLELEKIPKPKPVTITFTK